MTVNQLETNARFVGFLLVRSADARTDKKGGAYLDLTLADKTGDINCKYWDWNQLMDVPKQGSVIKVQGLVQEYNGRKQLRIERMRAALPQDEVDMAQLVACAPEKPEVMRKDIEDTIDTFQSDGLKKIVREMLRLTGDKLEWFPAAQRLHHAERSGLLHHTTSMLNLARHVVAAYPFLNAELLYAGVILHDLCKIHFYQPGTRNVKNPDTGRWETVPTYVIDERFPIGHGEKTNFIIQNYMKLKPEEAIAIRWHMGEFDNAVKGGDRSLNKAWEKYPLGFMLHMADMMASHLDEVDK